MKKSLITLTVMLAAAALVVVFCGPAAAKVTGVCSGCHTMHNSQGGTAMATGGPHATLLMNDCVGCHSRTDSATTYDIGGCTVPVVYNTVEPSEYLAGGNFYWVADDGCDRDAAGHNVLGISGKDAITLAGKSAPGGFDCGNDNCHKSLAVAPTDTSKGPGGCQGCHLAPAHHADDSNVIVGSEASDDDGFYRFLSGHMTGDGKGVCGIEKSDWQKNCDAGQHNEYLGNAINLSTSANMQSLGHTMTGYCCGCHGNFHEEKNDSGEWIRHPSDAKIPITGEYKSYTQYDPQVPVARPDLTGWTEPSTEVNQSGNVSEDMVMCLSCHRAHGSLYDDLLRWNYSQMIAGDDTKTGGCFVCHTNKNTGG